MVRAILTGAELARVEAAVAEAERRTSGEIVPYVVAACDDYDDAAWKGALLAAVGGAALAALLHWLAGAWGGLEGWMLGGAAAGAAIGWVAARTVPALRRSLVPEAVLDLRARRRAMVAFVDEELFDTRDRTGILLFVALFEHRVVVLGDAGINRAVRQEAWDGIVAELRAGIRAGRLADALVAAVSACGALLEAHRVEIRPDDADELPDAPRIRER